ASLPLSGSERAGAQAARVRARSRVRSRSLGFIGSVLLFLVRDRAYRQPDASVDLIAVEPAAAVLCRIKAVIHTGLFTVPELIIGAGNAAAVCRLLHNGIAGFLRLAEHFF